MVSLFCFLVIMAHIVAWLAMGGTWSAAFRAPIAVLIPSVGVVLLHSAMFHGFSYLPYVLGQLVAFEALCFFAVLCARTAVPKSKQQAVQADEQDA